MERIIEGNHAASYGALLSRVEVVSAYPITPQTQIVEKLADFCESGKMKARFIRVESEHSAMACCIGASSAGCRAFTATSSQGLALMHEMLHWASGARLPIVMANVNRSMGPPWNINCDHTDSLSQRDTGWMQVYCESVQEVLDSVIIAFKVAEQVYLPMMVCLDAFFLSHTSEPVEIPEQSIVDSYLSPYNPRWKLSVKDPHTFGGLAGPDSYFELRLDMQESMEKAKDIILKEDDEFFRIFNRRYGLLEEYMCEDAEMILVTNGTISSTARVVIDELRENGNKIGLLKIRVVRPFPFEEVKKVLLKAEKVAIIDRNISFGYGGIISQEIKSSLYGQRKNPIVFSYIAGLGGRDITPSTIREIIENTMTFDRPVENIIWIGAKK